MKFNSIEELKAQAIKDGACKDGIEWLDRQARIEEVLETIPHEYRLFCLTHNYEQFVVGCDWSKIDGWIADTYCRFNHN